MANNDITEQQLSSFLNNLASFPDLVSKECLVAVMPFLCQYVYPPCDGNGSAQFITQEQCVSIRDGVCKSEWSFAKATIYGYLLPTCEVFDTNRNFESVSNMSGALRCHYQFKEYCGVCLPLCSEFSQYSAQIKLIERILIIIAAVIAIIGGIIVFIAAAVRRQEM